VLLATVANAPIVHRVVRTVRSLATVAFLTSVLLTVSNQQRFVPLAYRTIRVSPVISICLLSLGNHRKVTVCLSTALNHSHVSFEYTTMQLWMIPDSNFTFVSLITSHVIGVLTVGVSAHTGNNTLRYGTISFGGKVRVLPRRPEEYPVAHNYSYHNGGSWSSCKYFMLDRAAGGLCSNNCSY